MGDDTLFSIIGYISVFLICFIVACVLNPYFWQSLRNSKFIDDLKHKKNRENKEIDDDR